MTILRNLIFCAAFVCAVLLFALTASLLRRFFPKFVLRCARALYILAARVTRLQIQVSGPLPPPGVLIVANHRSWADIVVLGSVCETGFVAKSEVRRWPLIGYAAAAVGTVFVRRDKPREIKLQRDALAAVLAAGRRTVLFAEGTTHDSRTLLPMKSALMAAVPEGARVVPAAIEYTRRYGIPGGRRLRAEESWIGEVAFFPHLRERLRGGPLSVQVRFCEPLRAENDRKALTHACRNAIQSALHDIHEGHG